MKDQKTFLTKEESDKYYNYLVVVVAANDTVQSRSFHSRKAAEKYMEQNGLISYGEIMTRRAFENYQKNNPNLIF